MLRDNQQFNESIKSNSAFLDELRQKMPEFFTATKYDEEGNVVEASTFDNEKFQQALKEHNIDELSSGYRLDFIGKNYAKKQAGERPTTVIVPDNDHNQKEENKNSKNLFFTGDNLEVLRHLQQNYANSVDFIYIDPPYNTGSDGFVYPDNFEYSDDQLKDMFALSDNELKRLKSIQGKATHAAWLTFMYPRLYLAKKVLKDTGVIFVSIDDNEQANLKLLMDEVFGEGSFVADIVWEKVHTRKNSAINFSSSHEYIICYARYKRNSSNEKHGFKRNLLPREDTDAYSNPDNDPKGPWKPDPITAHNYYDANYTIEKPNGVIINRPSDRFWVYSEKTLKEKIKNNEIIWGKNDSIPLVKRYLKDVQDGLVPITLFNRNFAGDSSQAKRNIDELFPESRGIFDYSKPVQLIVRLLQIGSDKNSIIFDFFAGTSTTAQAVMKLNSDDGGNRQYIMCTLPEPTFTVNSDGKEVPTKGGETAYKAGYKSIDEISRERIIRAANKIKEENPLLTETQKFGFKHYRVVPPTQDTLEKIDYDDQLQLDLFDDMIDAFSSEKLGVAGNAAGMDTILQTYLAKDNYPFDVPIERIDVAGISLPYVNNQRIYIITKDWKAENTKALVNAIGKNELVVQTIVVYGYTIEMESLRELEIALNQLENKVNLQVRY
ncbi:site-specific DNA-methyltransferase [Enterococcus mundtii]|uniref:site-specific DNA-methyltransferase n=1 Tax=Enterococcus mundtii TaxID=53346 RepID=UPI000D394FE6|nr:site-specific DNA-methyltransferase [Enterococcus mundtii]PTO39047.1 site-specific DNA-methyltransferase [Enterococcus mundtii]PTO41264.1 site-specific DNA-methyltransferase [Enterococcus mundtii]